MRRLRSPRAAVLALCGLFGACNGSGSFSAAITPDNAGAVAALAADSADLMTGMSEMVQGFSTVFEDSGSQLLVCDSGNASVDVNDTAPVGAMNSGDSASATFNGCVMDLGGSQVTMNGSISFSVTEATGSAPGPLAYTLSVSFQGFTVTGPDAVMTVNGGFTLELDTPDGIDISAIVSGVSFSAFMQTPEDTVSGTWRDFRFARTENTDTGAYTVEIDGLYSSSEFGGNISFETVSTFAGISPGHPSTGSLLATGALGTSVTLVALNDVDVELHVDIDGDGDTELTIPSTWDGLAD